MLGELVLDTVYLDDGRFAFQSSELPPLEGGVDAAVALARRLQSGKDPLRAVAMPDGGFILRSRRTFKSRESAERAMRRLLRGHELGRMLRDRLSG